MKLLENVRKYFGWEGDCAHGGYHCSECMALRVLEAMEQDISEGTKYLDIGLDFREFIWGGEGEYTGLHPYLLRLPDRFQPKNEVRPSEKKDYCRTRVVVTAGGQCSRCGEDIERETRHTEKPNPVTEGNNPPPAEHACDNYSALAGCECKEQKPAEPKCEHRAFNIFNQRFRHCAKCGDYLGCVCCVNGVHQRDIPPLPSAPTERVELPREVEEEVKAISYKVSSLVSCPYKRTGPETETGFWIEKLQTLCQMMRGR